MSETIDKQSSKKRFRKSNILIVMMLAVLSFISIAQTVQSVAILNKVDEIKASGVGNASLPNSVSDLPDMVGGC